MTAEPLVWLQPPSRGWTYEQVKNLDLPFDWHLVDGVIAPLGMTDQWHETVRDKLYLGLELARKAPYAANAERCVMFDESTVPKPDVVVFDRTGLDFFRLECVPAEAVSLAVEVVSHGSRSDDRFRKPGLYAKAGVPHFWRVERGDDDCPVVFEFHLDEMSGSYIPADGGGEHHGFLRTDAPFPVDIDLHAIFES